MSAASEVIERGLDMARAAAARQEQRLVLHQNCVLALMEMVDQHGDKSLSERCEARCNKLMRDVREVK